MRTRFLENSLPTPALAGAVRAGSASTAACPMRRRVALMRAKASLGRFSLRYSMDSGSKSQTTGMKTVVAAPPKRNTDRQSKLASSAAATLPPKITPTG